MNTQKLAREHRKLERRITRSQTKNSSLKMNTENIPGPNMSGITLTNEQFQQLLNIQQPRHENGNFSTCTNRFAGGTDEDVYAFIEAVYRLTAVE
ncbi:hypothetical protein MTP99_005837 [Tenebrio molitor]|jgi:hypothetical protein|nr:hypothetical protein MTP99_005837 [Tenebrio molitor]